MPEEDRVYIDEDRVYIDEAGVDDTLCYGSGWSPKGTRCLAERLGHRTCRVSMAAALCCGQILAPLTFQGYCDGALIEAWFEQQLCPALRPRQVVILDNASFHKSPRLHVLVEAVGCKLLFLPRYSPDLNPIEPRWNALKHTIAHHRPHFENFRQAVDAAFM